jgi:hypothetical protein
MDRFLFKLLIAKLSKTEKMTLMVIAVKMLKGLIIFIFSESRPGSFLFSHGSKTRYKRFCI